MSEANDGEEVVRKGNEWEVVAVTESVYAAAPGPQQNIPENFSSNLSEDDNSKNADRDTMLMSSHFGLLPSTHENSPLEPQHEEKHNVEGCGDDVPLLTVQEDIKNEEVMRIKEDKSNEVPDLPCEVWWRSRGIYGRVKNANPYWSIVVAAAVVGLVIIGHRWQRDKPEGFQVKSQLIVDDKGFSRSQSH